jgi:hypothetical protein
VSCPIRLGAVESAQIRWGHSHICLPPHPHPSLLSTPVICCIHAVQEKFSQSFLARECRNNKDSNKSEAEQISLVCAILKKWFHAIVPVFVYYSVSASAVPFFMGLNEFTSFLDECLIPDNESQGVKRSDLDTVFIVCTRKVWPPPQWPQDSVGARRGRQ